MREEPDDIVPCTSLTVEYLLRVGSAGAIWGLCAAPYDANKLGLAGFSRASFVATSVGKYSLQCGFVAAVFTMTRCGMQRYRRQNDWVNSLVGGAVAGAAVAAGTRSWRQVIGTACLVSAFSVAAGYSRTN